MAGSDVACTIALQMQFDGVNWTDVSSDVRIERGVQVSYGIRGNGPRDRVASVGTMKFAMDNTAEHNSGHLDGYYSLLNSNCRSGFAIGLNVRLAITYSGTTYYKFRGRLLSANPIAGKYRDRYTEVVVTDWMDEAARWLLKGIATQVNQRSDQIFSTIVAAIPIAPAAQSVGTGKDTYPYGLDNAKDETSTALSEFQRLAASEYGQIFVKGDTTQGGTLVFEGRTVREGNSTNAITLTETMTDFQLPTTRDDIYNRILVTVHPRRVDTSNVVLYSQNSVPSIAAGQTLIINGPYKDPTQTSIRVGGTSMVALVATTDYTMNTAADGSGTDLTGSCTVTVVYSANSATFTIKNNDATRTAFVTKLQCRGIGLYDYENAIAIAEDATSQNTYGIAPLDYDMPYQNDSGVASGLASYLLSLYKSPFAIPRTVTIFANTSDTLMQAALQRDVGSRIGLSETMTGASTGAGGMIGYFINGVDFSITPGQNLEVTWTLAPAAATPFWLLGVTGSSELGITTRLAYV